MFVQLKNVKDLNVFDALSNHGLVHNVFQWH